MPIPSTRQIKEVITSSISTLSPAKAKMMSLNFSPREVRVRVPTMMPAMAQGTATTTQLLAPSSKALAKMMRPFHLPVAISGMAETTKALKIAIVAERVMEWPVAR